MTYFIPCNFYPVEKSLSSHRQARLHRRVKRLVERGLAEKTYHYSLPRRLLVPLAAILSLMVLIGCSAATPEIRETVVRTAEKVSAVIEKILTREEARIDPWAVQVGQSVTNTESGITVTMDKCIRDGENVHLKLTFTSPEAFDGRFLQCDTMTLSRKIVPEAKYKNKKERWETVRAFRWGEAGILAGDILTLLEEGQTTASLWLELSPRTLDEAVDLPAGDYRLEITRLFGADDAAEPTPESYFTFTEYGDFTVDFTREKEIPVLEETEVVFDHPFTLGGAYFEAHINFVEGADFPEGIPMKLEWIRFHPLYLEVYITTEVTDKVCVLPGYEEYPFAPMDVVRNLYGPTKEYGLTGDAYRDFVQVGYKHLQPTFRDGVEVNRAETYSSFRTMDDKSYILYHIATTEPILPEDLLALTLPPFTGDITEPIVVWEAE